METIKELWSMLWDFLNLTGVNTVVTLISIVFAGWAAYYYEHINNSAIELPKRLPDENNVYHLFPIIVKDDKRDALHDYLAEKGIGTVIHYPIAPHKQECYAKEAWNTPQLSLPITEYLADAELSLPISPCMTPEQVEWVVKCVNEFK